MVNQFVILQLSSQNAIFHWTDNSITLLTDPNQLRWRLIYLFHLKLQFLTALTPQVGSGNGWHAVDSTKLELPGLICHCNRAYYSHIQKFHKNLPMLLRDAYLFKMRMVFLYLQDNETKWDPNFNCFDRHIYRDITVSSFWTHFQMPSTDSCIYNIV